jgi:hypothetical protein
MTGLGVERASRAAYPLTSVSPAGVSTPLPPHIQGAERRRSRWGLRLLVVGGLAGAAWLLTGAAAQAADRADGPVGSLLGAVTSDDAIAPVTGLLSAAAQPPETAPAHHEHHVVADILAVPQRVLTRPVETVSEVTRGSTGTTVDAATGSVGAVLREVAGPLRLTGGTTAAPQQVFAAVTDTVVTPVERPVAEPPVVAPAPVTEPETQAEPAAQAAPDEPVAPEKPVLRASAAGATRAVVVARPIRAASHHIVHRHRIASAATTGPAATSEDLPGNPGPAAPLQLHLGDVSGTPTSGSGTPTEGGSAAFLPAAIADSTMACHLLPFASDVEVRRYDAEAPTVSPD